MSDDDIVQADDQADDEKQAMLTRVERAMRALGEMDWSCSHEAVRQTIETLEPMRGSPAARAERARRVHALVFVTAADREREWPADELLLAIVEGMNEYDEEIAARRKRGRPS